MLFRSLLLRRTALVERIHQHVGVDEAQSLLTAHRDRRGSTPGHPLRQDLSRTYSSTSPGLAAFDWAPPRASQGTLAPVDSRWCVDRVQLFLFAENIRRSIRRRSSESADQRYCESPSAACGESVTLESPAGRRSGTVTATPRRTTLQPSAHQVQRCPRLPGCDGADWLIIDASSVPSTIRCASIRRRNTCAKIFRGYPGAGSETRMVKLFIGMKAMAYHRICVNRGRHLLGFVVTACDRIQGSSQRARRSPLDAPSGNPHGRRALLPGPRRRTRRHPRQRRRRLSLE